MGEQKDWTRAFKLMGTYNGEQLAIAVDENGKLYALLQGTYDSELRTVKLDDEGRISAFIIDSTDAWGNMINIGNAELAARLGCISKYERRGQVIMIEDFGCGPQRWALSGGGTGYSTAISPLYYASAGYSLALTAGSDGGKYASALNYQSVLSAQAVGIELAFSLAAQTDRLTFNITYYDGTTLHRGTVELDDTNSQIEVEGPGMEYSVAGTLSLVHDQPVLFNRVKLVVNFTTDKYVRLYVNNVEHDLSAYTLYTFASATGGQVRAQVTNYGRADNNDAAYLDAVLFTVAEP